VLFVAPRVPHEFANAVAEYRPRNPFNHLISLIHSSISFIQ
jgi:hypothetical protein